MEIARITSNISFNCQDHIKHKLQLLGLFVVLKNVKTEVDLKKGIRLMGENPRLMLLINYKISTLLVTDFFVLLVTYPEKRSGLEERMLQTGGKTRDWCYLIPLQPLPEAAAAANIVQLHAAVCFDASYYILILLITGIKIIMG